MRNLSLMGLAGFLPILGVLPILFVLLISPLHAQDTSEEELEIPSGSFTISKIEVIGQSKEKLKKVEKTMGLSEGDVVSTQDIRAAYRNLYEEEIYEDIKFFLDREDDLWVLQVALERRNELGKVYFSGNDGLSAFTLGRTVEFTKYFSDLDLRVSAEKIRIKYAEKGFPEVKIGYGVSTNQQSKIDVNFTIDEGNRYIVKKIDFEGNENVSSRLLRRAIEQKTEGFITEKGYFSQSKINNSDQAIIALYATKGYVDAKVDDVAYDWEWFDPNKRDKVRVSLKFKIDEGEKYTFGDFVVKGNRIFSSSKLLSGIRRVKGQTYNEAIHRADLAAIYNLYQENGYIFVRITPIKQVDEENRTISYVLDIYEGDKAHIERIFIQGLTKTKEYVVARQLSLEEGEIFSSTALRESIIRLNRLQYFSEITPDFRSGTVEGLLNLSFNLKEQLTATISGGFTYGSVSGFALNAELKESNFLGRGQTFSGKAEYGQLSKELYLFFNEPYFLSTRFSLGASLTLGKYYIKYYTDSQTETVKMPNDGPRDWVNNLSDAIFYTRDRIYASVFTSQNFWIWHRFGQSVFFDYTREYLQDYVFIGERYSQKAIYEVNAGLFNEPPPQNEFNLSFGLGLSYIRDSLNDRLNPSNGNYFKLYTTFFFGDYSLTKWGLEYSTFFSLVRLQVPKLRSYWSIIFAYQFKLDTMANGLTGNFNYPTRLFYFLDTTGLRGWNYSTVRNFRSSREGDAGLIEGGAYGKTKVEHRFELRLSLPVEFFQLVTFLDFANLHVDFFDFSNESTSSLFDLSGFMYSTGFGIRINLAQLPLRFFWGWRFIYDEQINRLRLYQHENKAPSFSIDFQRKI